jgi:3-oxoacyl-[acyl-carrier protein] reductase
VFEYAKLAPSGRDDDRARSRLERGLQPLKRGIAAQLASVVRIGENDHRRVNECRRIVGSVDARVKALDRARLQDVERLARGDGARRIHERDPPDGSGPRKRAGDGAAQISRTEDGDGLHRYGIVYVGSLSDLMSRLDRQVAIVTGGSRGIGHAVASALLLEGAAVVVTGTDDARLRDARETLGAVAGGAAERLIAVKADVRHVSEVGAVMSAAAERFGGIDALINNAGVGGFVDVATMTPDDWHRVIDTNLTGVFHCCHEAIPYLKTRGGGWIVNVSSLAGSNPFPGGAAYCASKAGLNAFSEALMQEVRHEGIRVSYVMPGSVRTAFSGAGDGPGTDWKLRPEDVAQVVVDLLRHPSRSLPSRVEIRPARPPRK